MDEESKKDHGSPSPAFKRTKQSTIVKNDLPKHLKQIKQRQNMAIKQENKQMFKFVEKDLGEKHKRDIQKQKEKDRQEQEDRERKMREFDQQEKDRKQKLDDLRRGILSQDLKMEVERKSAMQDLRRKSNAIEMASTFISQINNQMKEAKKALEHIRNQIAEEPKDNLKRSRLTYVSERKKNKLLDESSVEEKKEPDVEIEEVESEFESENISSDNNDIFDCFQLDGITKKHTFLGGRGGGISEEDLEEVLKPMIERMKSQLMSKIKQNEETNSKFREEV